MTHLALLLMVLMQGPSFHKPPEQAPAFQEWGEDVAVETNAGEDRRIFPMPPDIDARIYANSRGICPDDDAFCGVTLLYEVVLNAKDPDEATISVVRYILTGPSGTAEGYGWVDSAHGQEGLFIRVDGAWVQLLEGADAYEPEEMMVNTVLKLVERRIKARQAEKQQ